MRDALHKRPASLFSRVLPQPAGASRPPTRQTSFFTPSISASDRLVFLRTPQYVPINLSRPPQRLHSIAKAKHVTASLAKTRRSWPSPTRSRPLLFGFAQSGMHYSWCNSKRNSPACPPLHAQLVRLLRLSSATPPITNISKLAWGACGSLQLMLLRSRRRCLPAGPGCLRSHSMLLQSVWLETDKNNL